MSYDLALFPVSPGQSPSAVYQFLREAEEFETGPLPNASASATLRHLAATLKAQVPSLIEESAGALGEWIRLRSPAMDVVVTLHPASATIHMPYFRPEADAVGSLVCKCCAALQESAGYITYDPQLDRVLTNKPWWKVW